MLLFLAILVGCEPSCRTTCEKLLECEEVDSPQVALDDCVDSCALQQDLYQSWEDEQRVDDFGDLKGCIVGNECSEIASGECYDEELFIW